VNRWKIPEWLEHKVIERDRRCVYCGVDFTVPVERRADRPSWEHIINDARIVTPENIARCCIGCNASKGTKRLTDWLETRYCRTKGINRESVAAVVRAALGMTTPVT
jgi:5-methylcytosine-specific restriction endonuclease McrA